MTDRIANLWGKRTPFGPGEEWPVRVDQILEEGISEDDVDRWVQRASILNSNGDTLDIAVRSGRIVGVRGRGVDRVNKGRVDLRCACGADLAGGAHEEVFSECYLSADVCRGVRKVMPSSCS
jgi:hypothetical protein